MTKSRSKPVHKCRCSECVEQPSSEIALFHTSINRLVAELDEKHRRQFVGLLASQFGRGGIQLELVLYGKQSGTGSERLSKRMAH